MRNLFTSELEPFLGYSLDELHERESADQFAQSEWLAGEYGHSGALLDT